jgi:polyisoprenoid-binding protein YceI
MTNRISAIIALIALTIGAPVASLADTYVIDKDHTSATFQIRHLFTKVSGRFDSFEGKVDFDPAKPELTKVEGTIDTGSINTNVENRDKHLRSDAFFDVEKYPKITFASTKVTDVDTKALTGKLHGNLTIHGVEKPVVLDVQFLGKGKDPWGNEKAGFSARTKINRKDFGLNWNETVETGGLLVGEEVEIEISAEGNIPAKE